MIGRKWHWSLFWLCLFAGTTVAQDEFETDDSVDASDDESEGEVWSDPTDPFIDLRFDLARLFLDDRELEAIDRALLPKYYAELDIRRGIARRSREAILARHAEPESPVIDALRKHTFDHLDWNDLPIAEAVAWLTARTGVAIRLDPEVAAELDDASATLNLKSGPMTALEALDLLMMAASSIEMELCWRAVETDILVTSPADGEASHVQLHYLGDLTLARPLWRESDKGETTWSVVMPEEIQTLVRTVVPGDWDVGNHTIDLTRDGALLIMAPSRTQREVANFLNSLQVLLPMGTRKNVELTPPSVVRCLERLRAPIHLPSDGAEATSLDGVTLSRILTEQTGVQFIARTDFYEIQPIAAAPTTALEILQTLSNWEIEWAPINSECDKIAIGYGSTTTTLQRVVILPLQKQDLGYENHASDLVEDWGDAEPWIDIHLQELITNNIAPESWTADPTCEMQTVGNCLVVRQSPAVIEQIEALLRNLRQDRETERSARRDALLRALDRD